ncbi:unnamed protein product [Allacma fusca]|uniref:Uncharacterized protein n=1 Tax=Allacma fusca TaxID=39272 RepID=A0A8J2LVL2_9HEXA|nr:unnamed protein product [Allacma fusca]
MDIFKIFQKVKLEKVVKGLAWVDLVFTVLEIIACIYYLISFSRFIYSWDKDLRSGNADRDLYLTALIIIKFSYFIILLIIGEAILGGYLLRALSLKHLHEIKIWGVVSTIYAALYLTEFISTLHTLPLMEDFSLGFHIFVKVPLLIAVYKYHKQSSQNGENFTNELNMV